MKNGDRVFYKVELRVNDRFQRRIVGAQSFTVRDYSLFGIILPYVETRRIYDCRLLTKIQSNLPRLSTIFYSVVIEFVLESACESVPRPITHVSKFDSKIAVSNYSVEMNLSVTLPLRTVATQLQEHRRADQ